jgi:hypothetical protein
MIDKSRAKTGLIAALLVAGSLVIGTVAVTPYFMAGDERDPASGGLGMIHTHDMPTHLVLMEEFDKSLRGGTLYPRWLADINKGYGNPTMNFYPPGFFYLTSLVNLFFGDWVKTLFLISVLGLAGSGLALYFLSRQFYGRFASAIAAFFYMLLPYHVLELYLRGAMPEYIGFVIIPLILYFAFKTGERGRASDIAGLGLLYGAHLITHFPVSYLFTYLLAVYAVVWAGGARDLKIALRIAGGMALGLLMGAIYWLPAAVEAKYTQEFISETFPYEVTLFPVAENTPFDFLINDVFIAQAVTLLTALAILLLTRRRYDSKEDSKVDTRRRQTLLWAAMGIISTFMATALATPLTRIIPKLQATVPAWRWLAIACVFAALLLAAAVERVVGRGGTAALSRACQIAIFLMIGANVWFTVQQVIIGSFVNGPLRQIDLFLQSGFTPKESVLPGQLPDTDRVTMRPPVGAVSVIRWEPLFRELDVSTGLPAVIRLKTYKFPGWEARMDGQKTELFADASGVQTIPIPPGRHRVEIYFENTPPRTIGSLLSAGALAITLALLLYGLAFQKRSAGRRSAQADADN